MLALVRPHQQPGLAEVRTSWRVAVIGSLATIVESDLVDDLAEPARPERWSWVRPGRAAWSWWSDSASPASLERQKQYVDFAARSGWEYVLVDAGWDPAWLPALTAYARRRHVRVLLWSRWDALRPAAQRDALLSLWRSWGVAGVKLDFMHSDSHRRMGWYRGVARAAAERRLVVNFHGSTVPRGISRTWPNVLTSEGVLGAETYKGDAPVTPAHNATLPFTRNAIGSMDYTPVTFSAQRRQTSAAHELALSVVFESGLQHFADSPEAYAAQPAARRWLRSLPIAWDETKLLDGYPGASATIARRAGRRWYVGAIDAGAGRAVRLPLDFLFPRRRYVARVVEDAPGGGLRAGTRRVTARSVLRLRTGPAGGYAMRSSPRTSAADRSDGQREVAAGDVEHDGLAFARGDRQRGLGVARRERRRRDGAPAERARQRHDRVGQQLDAAQRPRPARRSPDPRSERSPEPRAGPAAPAAAPRSGGAARVASPSVSSSVPSSSRSTISGGSRVEQHDHALRARAGGEVLDGREHDGKRVGSHRVRRSVARLRATASG